MAYKFQKGAFHADGLISGSSTAGLVGRIESIGAMASSGSITAGTSFIIGSADLNETDMEKLDGITDGAGAANKALVLDGNADVASGLRSVTASADLKAANVHATQFYGGGAGITGLTVAAISGTTAQLTTGVETSGYLKVTGSTTLAGAVSSSAGGVFVGSISSSGDIAISGAYHGDGSNLTGIAGNVSGSARHYSSTGLETSGYLKVSGSVTFAGTGSMSDINMSGALSGSGDLLFQGGANLGSTLNVTGAISGANLSGEAGTLTSLNLQVGGITNAGAVAGGTTATFSSTISGSGIQGEAGVLTSLNLQVGGITNAGALAGVTTATLSGLLSSSAGAQVVGNTIFGGQLAVSGGAQYKVTTVTTNTHLTASTATMYQVVSGGTTALTVMLPSASEGENYQYAVKRHALMSGTVTITGSDIADVIDGEATLQLQTAGASVFLISDGTQWNIF